MLETLSSPKCRFLTVKHALPYFLLNRISLWPKRRGLRVSSPFLLGLCISRVDGHTRYFSLSNSDYRGGGEGRRRGTKGREETKEATEYFPLDTLSYSWLHPAPLHA